MVSENEYYKKILKILGSLTNLFSESKVPYLNYRITENLFCKAFTAKNLSRSDVSADASLNGEGIGIKTFVNGNGKTFQKIAEFNKDKIQFRGLQPKEFIDKITDLRNERIETTMRIYGLYSMIYHCIVRDKGKIKTFECDMNLIDKPSMEDKYSYPEIKLSYITGLQTKLKNRISVLIRNSLNGEDPREEGSENDIVTHIHKRAWIKKVLSVIFIKPLIGVILWIGLINARKILANKFIDIVIKDMIKNELLKDDRKEK